MKIKILSITKQLFWCIGLAVCTSCQNDDQNDPAPLSQEDYVTYESNLLGHMRHFGEQIRSNSSLGFDDESLKSISSSYFEGADHAAFVDAIDNSNTEPLSGSLLEKVDALNTSISDQVDHSSYLNHLDGEFQNEFDSEELLPTEKQALLNHIVHLRVATQFVNEHQDLFDTRSASGGRLASSDWWNSWGKCALSILAGAAAGGIDATDNGNSLEGKATGSLAGGLLGANAGCVNALSLEAYEFFQGIQNNPYCGGDETCNEMNIYNMYSYAFLEDVSAGYQLNDVPMPPVENLDNFQLYKSLSSGSVTITGEYDKTPSGPYIGITNGKYYSLTDCSGFVSYVMAQATADAYQEIQDNLPSSPPHRDYCPSAAQFATYDVTGSSYWEAVTDFSTIQAGDIIAWNEGDVANCPGMSGGDKDGDTGHVMIAAGPAQGPFKSQVNGESDYYTVDIYDSTVDAHLNNVRNGVKTNGDPTGVGRGTIGLIGDATLGIYQSNFYPELDNWNCHPNISVLRLKSD